MAESPQEPRGASRFVWLGVGGFGLAALALAVFLLTSLTPRSLEPTAETEASENAAGNAADTGDEAPPAAANSDLKARQQVVSDVWQDLDRATLIGNSPTRGDADADVVVMEFSDFQCPYCARAAQEVKQFVDANTDDVLFVYKHLPLAQIHPQAIPAAKAAWAAGQQGQFWAYHDALFANQSSLGEPLYQEIATTLGLDMAQFNQDRNSEAAQRAIARDMALAAELQLNSTPTFLINDILVPGAVPASFFEEALTRLKAQQAGNP